MNEHILAELAKLGQSVWLDDIGRGMLEDGGLARLIGLGLRGMTSNPTIFEKAVREGPAYDRQIRELCGVDPARVCDALTIADIRLAADLFMPVFRSTGGVDGWVSLELNPELARDAEASVAEAKRLRAEVDRTNVMFKVPATREGVTAIEECVAAGMDVNVTLIFSLEQYVSAASAYLRGLERLAARGGARRPRSVASVFVSRVDTAVDRLLEGRPGAEGLKGTAAVANAALIYEKYRELFPAEEGAQRLLWGSTGTKNPAYGDLKYVEELVGRGTVNTMPRKTLDALLDHGRCAEALTPEAVELSRERLKRLEAAGIDLGAVCSKLQDEGVEAFASSYRALLGALEEKAGALCAR